MENQTSFDLNAAVQRWRAGLARSSSFGMNDLEELESHVRDSEALLRAQGLSAEEAFLIAIRRTGSRDVLAAEFAAVNGSSVWLDRLLWMTTGWITMSALLSLITTLMLGTVFAWFPPVVLALAVIAGLQPNLLRQPIRAPIRLAFVFLLVSLFSVMLFRALSTNVPMSGVIANFSYVMYNLTVFIQCLVSAGVIAVFAFKRLRRSPA